MGRRSFGISASQIRRFASAIQSAERAKERDNLINTQIGIQTRLAPQYSFVGFDFNEDTRISHCSFKETTQYRKIVRYVTQNGVRHPIYGDWCSKTKIINKTLKLTNSTLENLKRNEDKLISEFCYEIVLKLNNDDFYPSWFIIETLRNIEKNEVESVTNKYDSNIHKQKSVIKNANNLIQVSETIIQESELKISLFKKKQIKIEKQLNNAKNQKHLVLFSILSIGIYYAFHSKRYIKKKENKRDGVVELLNMYTNRINGETKRINENKLIIQASKKEISDLKEEKMNKVNNIKDTYYNKILEVKPLPIFISSSLDTGFIPLKKIIGMNYEKIVGCYVIHNIEKDKYYVGQSKDVLKRICKDHFEGTKVKNIIFAEDYFTSKYENKDNLFEVKIIRLNTKDELDAKEKELIEAYDSFNNGYNGTSGNK